MAAYISSTSPSSTSLVIIDDSATDLLATLLYLSSTFSMELILDGADYDGKHCTLSDEASRVVILGRSKLHHFSRTKVFNLIPHDDCIASNPRSTTGYVDCGSRKLWQAFQGEIHTGDKLFGSLPEDISGTTVSALCQSCELEVAAAREDVWHDLWGVFGLPNSAVDESSTSGSSSTSSKKATLKSKGNASRIVGAASLGFKWFWNKWWYVKE